jgi:hypothetical protein
MVSLKNHLTFRNNFTLIRLSAETLVVLSFATTAAPHLGDRSPFLCLPKLRALSLYGKFCVELSITLPELACPELEVLYLETYQWIGAQTEKRDWTDLFKQITAFQRPLKYLKISGCGPDTSVMKPLILDSRRISLIPNVHFDIVNDDEWSSRNQGKSRFRNAIHPAHPLTNPKFKVYLNSCGANNRAYQCVRRGWFDDDVLEQLDKELYLPDMGIDNSKDWRDVHQHVADRYAPHIPLGIPSEFSCTAN